jgi:chromosome segregation ATPase
MDPGDGPDGAELAAMQEQLAEARTEVERLQRAAANAVAEAAFLRDDVRMSNEAVAVANSEAEALRTQLAEAGERTRAAVERYRELVVRTEPSLPADLIDGEDADAIDASAEAARSLLARVREGMARQYDVPPVPAGSPARRSPDLSALTPEQKIRYGLGARG